MHQAQNGVLPSAKTGRFSSDKINWKKRGRKALRAPKRRLLFLLGNVLAFARVFEFFHAPTEATHELRNFAATKEEQNDNEDDDDLGGTERNQKHRKRHSD